MSPSFRTITLQTVGCNDIVDLMIVPSIVKTNTTNHNEIEEMRGTNFPEKIRQIDQKICVCRVIIVVIGFVKRLETAFIAVAHQMQTTTNNGIVVTAD